MLPRRPSEPLAPISHNVTRSRHTRPKTKINAYDIENAMEDGGRVHDEFTIQSQATNISSLEQDTTDDFGKLLLQHARDEQRMQDALKGKARPFSKARPRERGRLTLSDLERSLIDTGNNFEQRRKEREASLLSFSSPPASVSSGESRQSEPSLNIPKEWGRKARRGTDWLRRSLDRHDDAEEEVILRRTTAYTGDGTPRAVDWANAASEVPLPTMDDSPSALRYARGTPPSIQKRDEAAARVKQWDIDEEFTSTSIIASTPALPRNTRLDDIRLRELDTVTEVSGVELSTAQSPEQPSSPVQQSISRSAERRKQRAVSSQPSASWSHPAEQPIQLPKREILTRQSEEKVALQPEQDDSSPVVVYKSTEAPEGLRQRPQNHRRADSHDLLRRLARAASGSPSPQRAANDPANKQQLLRSDAPAPSSKEASTIDLKSPSKQPARATVPEPRSFDRQIANLPDEDSLAVDAVNPRTPVPDELLVEAEKQSSFQSKTPIVTGAWIDTPAPATERRAHFSPRKSRFSPPKSRIAGRIPSPPRLDHFQQGLTLPNPEPATALNPQSAQTKPSLPPSALAAVLHDARTHPTVAEDGSPYDQELNQFGDSTINSLEDLVDTSLAAPLADDTVSLDLATLLPPSAKPKNAAERQRFKEIEQVSRMNKQLRDARHNIRDARVGLRRFENAMISGEADDSVARGGRSDGCDTCGCPGGARSINVRNIGQSIAYTFLVSSPSPTEAKTIQRKKFLWPWRWRLTWIGFILFSLLTYTLLETTLCAQYCQPRYATSMTDYGVDPNAPRLPFVTPTLLSRPLKPFLQPLYRMVRTNGAMALRAYGLLPEEVRENLPWLTGRPTLSPAERQAWDSMIAAAKRTAAPDVTRWAEMVATAMGAPASTAVRWAQTAATAAVEEADEVLGMGADEVLI